MEIETATNWYLVELAVEVSLVAVDDPLER